MRWVRCTLLVTLMLSLGSGCGCRDKARSAPVARTAPWMAKGPVGGPDGATTSADLTAAAAPVDLLAMGDWGQDSPGQRRVAAALTQYATDSHAPFTAMLLLGDNFKMGLSGIDDPAWQKVFETMYDAKALNMPFFAALGNHDYEGKKAQIEADYAKRHPESRWKFPARWYRINIPADKPSVVVLMLDSNQPDINAADWAAQMKWMDEQLANIPAGCWTIACAHHPLFSNGSHGDNGELTADWGPIFKKRALDFYLCGHDHNLQHLELAGWPTTFVVSGGGGSGTYAMRRDDRGPFSRNMYGFFHLHIAGDLATGRCIGDDGAVAHAFTRTKAGEVKALANSPSDAATSKPLKALQGVGPPVN